MSDSVPRYAFRFTQDNPLTPRAYNTVNNETWTTLPVYGRKWATFPIYLPPSQVAVTSLVAHNSTKSFSVYLNPTGTLLPHALAPSLLTGRFPHSS